MRARIPNKKIMIFIKKMREPNDWLKATMKARNTGATSFVYNGKTYREKVLPSGMTVYSSKVGSRSKRKRRSSSKTRKGRRRR